MRQDMSKVLVESPRSGRGTAHAMAGSRRQARNRIDRDGEGGPVRLSMQQDGCKHFGEHLGPLYRYLRKQVNRPWDKVYGELCAGLDKRSVVQAHLFQHIGSEVEIETVWRDDAVWAHDWRGRFIPIAESHAQMFVHPRTGILLVNRAGERARQRRNEAWALRHTVQHADRRVGLPGMGDSTQWHRVGGVWYEVTLGTLSGGTPPVYDVVLKRPVSASDGRLLEERYGARNRYAIAKRQLDGRRLRAQGLVSAVQDG